MRTLYIIGMTAILWLLPLTMIQAQAPMGASANGTSNLSDAVVTLSITYTPRRSWTQTYNPHCTKSAKCSRIALRYVKKDDWMNAMSFAAIGLDLKKVRRKTEGKLLSVLTQSNYDKAYAIYDKNKANLNPRIGNYEGVISATHAYNLQWHMMQMAMLNQSILSIDNTKMKIQIQPIAVDDIEHVSRVLEDYKIRASDEYLAAGKKAYAEAKEKYDFKMTYHYLDIATQYNPANSEAYELAKQAKGEATSTIYIAPARYASSYNKVGFALDEEIRAELFADSTFERLPFFDVTTQKNTADYELRTLITKYHIENLGQEAKQNTFTKTVSSGKQDADGKDIKVEKTSNVTVYTKTHLAHASVVWEIVEHSSGKIMKAGETQGSYTWQTTWANGTNPDIVPSKIRALMEKKPDKKPANIILYQKAIQTNAYPIVNQILSRFIIREGNGLDH